MCSRYWRSAITILILPALVCPFVLALHTGQVYGAPAVVDLQLDNPAVIRWDISNIMPGDSGIEPINLHNVGNAAGFLYIWITDLVDDEGENPESEAGNTDNPGELSHYIYLNILNDGMIFRTYSDTGQLIDINLPISLNAFPAGSNKAICIANPPLGAGETLELQWQWELISAAGNEVQGDTVSFSIYYMLSDQHIVGSIPPPYQGTTQPLPPVTPVTPDGVTPEPEPPIPAREYASDEGRCIISIPAGMHIMTGSGKELEYIIIDIPGEIPPIPGPFILITPVYRIIVHTADGMSEGTQLKQPVELTMYYNTDKIPENAQVYILSYNPDSGWVRLDYSGDPSSGQLTAWMDYLNLVAIVVGVEKEEIVEIPIEPDIPEPAPPTPKVEQPDVIVSDLDTGATSGGMMLLKQASLGIALSGSAAMAILAFIQRRRRNILNRVQE
jgi:hypothetical protein